MPDVKISALPASTTPLAGTEVLPIVQSATTRQVSVANLTAGRAVSALSIATTTGATFATTSGSVGIGTASPSAILHTSISGSGEVGRFATTTDNTPYISIYSNGSIRARLRASSAETALLSQGATALLFGTNDAEKMRITSDGNVGIGTSPNASYLLDVAGKIRVVPSSGNAELSIRSPSGSSNYVSFSEAGVADRGVIGFANGSGALQFRIGAYDMSTGTQSMTLDASGNLLVGTTSTAGTVVGARMLPTGLIQGTKAGSTDADTQYDVYSTGASAYRFYVGMGGTIFATSIVISAISDQRLKENIRDLDTGLSTIMALKPRRFDWKEGKGQDKKNVAGFIAQEYQEVLPNSISTFKQGDDGIDYLTMNHEELIPTLVKALQELKAEFDAYKATHP